MFYTIVISSDDVFNLNATYNLFHRFFFSKHSKDKAKNTHKKIKWKSQIRQLHLHQIESSPNETTIDTDASLIIVSRHRRLFW